MSAGTTIVAEFDGTYQNRCEFFKEKTVGAITCVGHSVTNTPKCEYCIASTERIHECRILKKSYLVTATVTCGYQEEQLKLL